MFELVYKLTVLVHLGLSPQHAMTSIISILELVAVASMASVSARAAAAAPVDHGCAARVTSFVCVKCMETGQLSSQGLFFNQAVVQGGKSLLDCEPGLSGDPSPGSGGRRHHDGRGRGRCRTGPVDSISAARC